MHLSAVYYFETSFIYEIMKSNRVISQHSTELLLITFDSMEQSELLGSYVRHVQLST